MRLVHRAATASAVGALVLTAASPALSTAGASPAMSTGESTTYVVLYKQEAVPADLAARVARAGGTLVAAYDAIGVAVARASSRGFATQMRSDSRVSGVAASTTPIAATGPQEAIGDASHDQPSELPNAPATPDDLAALQWDMRQISAFEAHAITGGSPAVVVGDIDTGLDKDHPDLQPNIDYARSVSCESGAPDPNPAAWDDRHGHGTHTAGTIAAADNDFGITGVAPNVKVAGIKSSTDEGFFFAHMVVCAFMWAGSQHMDVTNNSYYMDPFLYNCRNDAEQRLLWKAAQRAALYAQRQGTLHVASQGNDSDDRAHPTYDASSPDYPPGNEVEREITNACVVVPLELPGVVGVTAVGNTRQTDGDEDPDDYLKSFYSAYGSGVAELTAPGGDSVYGRTAEAPNGRVLSTWPADTVCTQPGPTTLYCYAQGTSMAAPHVAGVAALIVSRYGDADSSQNGKMRPGAVAAVLQQTADPQPCPSELPPGYLDRTRPDGSPQECTGGPGYSSWYGNGQVNALSAVLHAAGNR